MNVAADPGAASPGDRAAREELLHAIGELRRGISDWIQQQDRLETLWIGRYSHLEELLNCAVREEPKSESVALSCKESGTGPEAHGLSAMSSFTLDRLDRVAEASSIPEKDGEVIVGNSLEPSSQAPRPSAVEILNSYLPAVRQNSASTSTTLYARDTHAHWRRMIRKRHHAEPLSAHSRAEQVRHWNWLQRVVHSRGYEWASLTLVILNAAFIGWQVQYLASHGEAPNLQDIVGLLFTIVFTVELLVRLLAERRRFFQTEDWTWNVFDICVVTMMLTEQVIDSFSAAQSNDVLSNMSTLRVLRVVRIVRLLRVIRVLTFFRELRIMVHSIFNSMKTLAWAFLVQMVVFYIFGISLMQGVADYCARTESWHNEETRGMRHYFGSLGSSILSLFEAMSGGINWGEMMDAIALLDATYQVIFFVYIFLTIFAVTNIVTAVFIEGCLLKAQQDREVIIQEQMRSNQSYLDSMQQVLEEMDRDGDGCIELEELRKAIKDPRVVAYFHAFGLDISEVNTLFVLLDRRRTGSIEIEEFLLGCLRLKGEAKALAMAKLQYDSEWMVESMGSLKKDIEVLCGLLRKNFGFQWHVHETRKPGLETDWNWKGEESMESADCSTEMTI